MTDENPIGFVWIDMSENCCDLSGRRERASKRSAQKTTKATLLLGPLRSVVEASSSIGDTGNKEAGERTNKASEPTLNRPRISEDEAGGVAAGDAVKIRKGGELKRDPTLAGRGNGGSVSRLETGSVARLAAGSEEIEKLKLRHDLLAALKRIIDNNEQAKLETLKRDLSNMAARHAGIVKLPENAAKDESKGALDAEDVTQIELEVGQIIFEAQAAVNAVLNTRVAGRLKELLAGTETIARTFDFFDALKLATVTDRGRASGSSPGPPAPEEFGEHILEAPEGFRSNDGERSARGSPEKIGGWATGVRLKCRGTAAEPERRSTDRVHDNKLTQEADPCGRTTKEEAGRRENEITDDISAKNHVKPVEAARREVQGPKQLPGAPAINQSGVPCLSTANADNGEPCQCGNRVTLAAAVCVLCNESRPRGGAGNDQIGKAIAVEQHVGLATPVEVDDAPRRLGLTQNSITGSVMRDAESVRPNESRCGDDLAASANNLRAGSGRGRAASGGSSPASGECAGNPQTTAKPSIEIGVIQCAQPPGCSRDSELSVCVALDTLPSCLAHTGHSEIAKTGPNSPSKNCGAAENEGECAVKSVAPTSENGRNPDATYLPHQLKNQSGGQEKKAPLSWSFKNGRLVFDLDADASKNESERVPDTRPSVDERSASDDVELSDVLYSKDLNKKSGDSRQLKLLEQKLKQAGITDGKLNTAPEPEQVVHKSPEDDDKHAYDDNQNILRAGDAGDDEDEDLIPSEQDYPGEEFSEFDATKIITFTGHDDADFYVLYDELEDSSDDEHCHIISRRTMRGDGSMGTNGERKQHNPDRDNLKSLLKKPGRGKDAKKNRVVFNENKNEFFDADYIILIREECDYDEEDDDGICTCNQHEMVRLTCCEPNCNCNAYEGFGDPTPQSPKFAPPLEFVDAVTLSPPEEYKDMELEEQQLFALQQMARRGQRAPVCRECSASHEDEGDGSQSENEEGGEPTSDRDEAEEKEKTDQSQQTTPTTPPADSDSSPNSQRYILETISMTTVSERRIMKEIDEESKISTGNSGLIIPTGGSPISGILKGGRLWKQASVEVNNIKMSEPQQATDSGITSDDDSCSRRSVRFIENEETTRDVCDGAPDRPSEEGAKPDDDKKQTDACNNSVSPDSTEMMLTFKLGNHVLISNNSLKPNSAVRQLFPCTKPLGGKAGDDESVHQYLVTAESLKAFEEAKRAKLPQIIQSGESDESIRRAIERNTLRRSLIRYEPRTKKNIQKTDNSLVERIKQLTCDVDDDIDQEAEEISQRASPPGEESRHSPEAINKGQDKSFSPSSSSTTSSNSSSMSSTYKKITDLFAKREKIPDIQNVNEPPKMVQATMAPDLGNGTQEFMEPHCPTGKVSASNETRKQFLSTLAPLTACVSGIGPADDYYYHMNNHTGERTSVASSIGTEYSLEDIDEGLKKDEEDSKRIAPDVLAGTPSASESGDELAMFVQQDAGRIERIKKKYQAETTEEDDEHDDYGFNRRPSVRGIKPRFGSTTEILQQIQNQMQPPNNTPPRTHVAWPYYSETNLSGVDNTKARNINQNVPTYQYPSTPEEIKRAYAAHQYRPTAFIDENIYQNCTNQRCTQVNYRTNMNVYAPVVKVGGGCSDYYQSLPRNRNGRPQSPPPQEIKNYHQTMVYIPYNHIEGYQPMSPNPYYSSSDACYARVTNQNQINKRYLEPTYQQRIGQQIEDHYQQKPAMRVPYPSSNHLVSSRSESPLPGQFSTARSTQTPVPNVSTCTYYPPNVVRYRPMVGPINTVPSNGMMWQGDGAYVGKIGRHSFPAGGPRYPPPDNISLTDSESQHSGQMPNGYRQPIETCFGVQKDSIPNSPTKPRFIERGVPEGAASVSPQDSIVGNQSTSTMTSPTSPQNPPPTNPKPLFYAMNV